MQTIKKNWLFYLYIIAVIFLGLYINKFSFHRLPLGEDDLSYFGTIKRYYDLGLGNLNFIDLALNPKGKLLLFYLIFWPWHLMKNSVSIITYYNLIYLLFYLGGFFSFYRLTKINGSSISRYLMPLFYVLIVSNTFWLGPRYFVPAFWLFIAIPNLIYCCLKKKYIGSIIWLISIYFFYLYGLALGGMLFILTTVLVQIKPVWSKFIFSTVVFCFFCYWGLTYAGDFINKITYQSIIENDVWVLNNLNIGFSVLLLGSLVLSLLYKISIRWNQIFVALLLFFIFYIIITTFPEKAPSYRLIIMLYTAIALVISSFPDIFAKKNWLFMTLGVVVLSAIIYSAYGLLLININQAEKDLKNKSILSQEITLFEQINKECDISKCLVVSDPATMRIGTYFSPIIGPFHYRNLKDALSEPDTLVSNNYNYDQIILITSKRTTMIYGDWKVAKDYAAVSRSYSDKYPDPMDLFENLWPYQENIFYKDEAVGLYAFRLK